MKVFILYRPNSEFARRAEEYVHDFKRTRGQDIDLVDVDTVDGTEIATLYDVMDYPTLLIVRETGEVINQWQGIDQFPLMNELAAYLAG